MKTVTATFEKIVQEERRLTQTAWLQVTLQLAINVAALYAANHLTLLMWRAMTGH